eukprot:1675645-Prymnesium_polylepis.1
MRVSVEPDKDALVKFLNVNVKANGCSGVQVWGVADSKNAKITGGSYGTHTAPSGRGEIPGYSITALEQKLPALPGGKAAAFTALVIDCEGCAFRFIEEHEAFMRSTTLTHVFLEADGPNGSPVGVWEQYTSDFIPRMCEYGFDVAASIAAAPVPALADPCEFASHSCSPSTPT